MPSVSARTLITDAFITVGVFSPGDTIPAAQATQALRRLNLMMSGLRLQPLSQPVQAREVFPLTADLGVYTIGPGGDFDTVRPTSLSGAAILLNSEGAPVSVSSLTRSGNVATATVTSHGAETGQNVTIAGAEPEDYNGTFPITVTGVSTFTYLIDGEVATPATGTITASFESINSDAQSVVEVQRGIITDQGWHGIRIKSLTSAQFTVVYYNPTYSANLGTINLWPIPNVATNSLVLYRLMPLNSFATLDIEYSLPDGAQEALMYALARRLITPWGVTDQQTVADTIEMATTTMANFKRANMKLADLATDPALTLDPAGGYNILTGTGGGSTGV